MNKTSIKGFSSSHITVNSFKTTLASVTFTVALDEKYLAANSVALRLLESCPASCKDKKEFSRLLSGLYGTKISSEIAKDGDCQVLRISVSYIDDDFLPNNDVVSNQIEKLVCDLIFGYKLQQKEFDDKLIEEEKRLLCEEIAGNLNDKRLYARKRAEEITCGGEPFALQPTGTINEVKKLTKDDICKAYDRLLSTAFIHLQTVGKQPSEGLFREFEANLSQISRSFSGDFKTVIKSAKKVEIVTEDLAVNQGKLVMSLRTNNGGDDVATAPFFVMCDIFGGAPYSKLFTNVREKMSLCYYCSARPVKKKGLIFVESGIEFDNAQKAMDAIKAQFEDIKQGNFDQELIDCSKRASTDALKALYSNQSALDRWYAIRSSCEKYITTDDFAAAINAVTKQDIMDAAKQVEFDSIYIIKPQGEK